MGEITSQLAQIGSCPPENAKAAGGSPLGPDGPIGNQTNTADSLRRSADSPAALAYIIQSPLRKAVKALRASFEADGLEVVSETDIADKVRATLGTDLAPSRVFSVTSPFLLLEALVMQPALLTILPLHVLVIEKEHWTCVYVPNPMRLGCVAGGAFAPKLHELSVRIRQCLDRIAARIPSACAW